MIKLNKINDSEIVCDWKDKNIKPLFKGQEEITGPTLLFPNIIITSQKGSGKTVVAVNIIRKLATNKTKIIIFSSTFSHGDDKLCFEDLQEKYPGMIEIYPRLKTKEGDILSRKIEEAKDRYEIIKNNVKYTHTFPNYIFLFDDLDSDDLRDPTIEYLYRTNRHIGSVTILIEHRLSGAATPVIRDNSDILIVFKGLSTDQIDDIFKMSNIPHITKKDFTKIYQKAIEGKHSFLFINKTASELRKNLNELIIIE